MEPHPALIIQPWVIKMNRDEQEKTVHFQTQVLYLTHVRIFDHPKKEALDTHNLLKESSFTV